MMELTYRIVNTDFWRDDLIMDNFTPEDKYFMLYLLTNYHTRQSGIYKVLKRDMSHETGYSNNTIMYLIERFEKYGIIKYSHETQEVAILNYIKHSVVKGGTPVNMCITKDLSTVKNKDLIVEVYKHMEPHFKKLPDDKVAIKQIGEIFRIEANKNETTLFNVNMQTAPKKKEVIPYQIILDYLNSKQPSKRAYGLSDETKKMIKARWTEGLLKGYSAANKLKHFLIAIDNSFAWWTKNDGLQNMRPGIVFNGKMESRVNGDLYSWAKNDPKKPDWYDEYEKERVAKDAVIKTETDEKISNLDLEEVSRKFSELIGGNDNG